jgi:hypothetical protein
VTATHRRFAGGSQSSDGGVLLLREAERKHGVCLRLAEAMPDRRDPDRIQHAMFEMVMSVFWRSPATRMPSTSTARSAASAGARAALYNAGTGFP